MYRCVRDDWQLCLVHVDSLITHLQLKKMLVIIQSAHVAITFQLLEMSSITTPNQIISNIHSRYKFSRKNISDFTNLHNEKKSSLEVPCKRNCFGYWNLCKRLPNFVNVAALGCVPSFMHPQKPGCFIPSSLPGHLSCQRCIEILYLYFQKIHARVHHDNDGMKFYTCIFRKFMRGLVV